MAKFWRAWRADEIVAVYQGRDKDGKLTKDIKVHLRSGGSGTAYGCDSDKAVREIEAVLASESRADEWERLAALDRRLHETNTRLDDAERRLRETEGELAKLPVLDGEPGKTLVALVDTFVKSGKQYPTKAWRDACAAAIDAMKEAHA